MGDGMKKTISKIWIKALRSGEFNQGSEFLERDGKYCALGVLALLSLVGGQCTYNFHEGIGQFDNKRSGLSFNTMKWAEIKDFHNPDAPFVPLDVNGTMSSITKLNDSGMSFNQIADLIEKYWKIL